MVEVTVVVNTVDRPLDLGRCLDSIFNQTYRDFEVVVVNNGTSEEAKRVLNDFRDRFESVGISLRVVDDPTKKLSYLFNLGWKSADKQARFFAYIADDAEADRSWLGVAVDYLKGSPSSGAVSGPMISTANPPGEMFYLRDLAQRNILTKIFLRIYEYFVMEDKTMEPGFWPQSGAFTMGAGIPLPHIKEPIEIDLLTSGNMVVKREVMEAVGGFDENFYFNHADGDLFIRMKRAGYRMIFHPQVSVLHHMRFGPTRYPWIFGRDTGFYYLKDVRPRSLRGWIGAFMNLLVFNSYFVFKTFQLKRLDYLRGISGFFHGIFDFFVRNTPARNEILVKFFVGAGFLTLFSYVYKDLWRYSMLAYGDAVPFPPTILQAWEQLIRGWDLRSPGTLIVPQIHILYSLLPLEIFLLFISGGNAVIAQRLFHYLPMPLSFIVVYGLLSRLVKSRIARFLAAFIYSLNLLMVGEFLGGFEGNLYVQVFMPLLLFWLWRIYEGRRFWTSAITYTLVLSLTYVLSDHVFLFLFPFWVLLALAAFFRSYRSKVWSGFWWIVSFLVFSHLLIFVVTAYHSYYYFRVALPFLAGEKLPAHVLEFLKRNVDDTYRFYTLGNALRTGGSYFMNLFGQGVLWAKAGFSLPILAFSWFLFQKNRRHPRLGMGLFLTFLAIADLIFINYSGGERLSGFYHDWPFLFRFRNPSRPTLFLLMIYTVLVAFTVDALISQVKDLGRRSIRAWLLLVLLTSAVLLVVFYFKPALSGDLTMGKNRGARAQLTQPYYDLGKWLADRRDKEGFFRTLHLPWDHENAEVKLYWIDPYALAVPINYGAYQPGSKYLPELKRVYEDLVKKRNPRLSVDLAEFGVKYIIINLSNPDKSKPMFSYDYQTPWLLGSPEGFREIVEGYGGLGYEETVSGFHIYRNLDFDETGILSDKAGWPPSNYSDLRRVHFRLLWLSGSSLVFLLVALAFVQKRSL